MMLQILVSLLILSPFISIECSSDVPAVYVFGDSLSDAGNNNHWLIPVFARSNYPPYGINFPPNGDATGRFSNGETFPDIIARELGLPYPLAYRYGPRATNMTGYTYASGGCGILNQTGQLVGCVSFDRQINNFRDTITKELRPQFETPTQSNEYLSKSIFIIWAGSNDYLINYFNGNSPNYNSTEFAQLLVDSLQIKLQTLYELGARKFVVLEVGPLGCIPVYRANGGHGDTWCDEGKNANATMFNARLASMVQTLNSTYLDSQFTLGHIYNLSDDAFKNPSNYGLINVSQSCCKTGDLFGIACNRTSPVVCPTPNQYLFFDGAHPSETAFRILASHCFNGSGVCVPHNIQQLAQLPSNSLNLLSAA